MFKRKFIDLWETTDIKSLSYLNPIETRFFGIANRIMTCSRPNLSRNSMLNVMLWYKLKSLPSQLSTHSCWQFCLYFLASNYFLSRMIIIRVQQLMISLPGMISFVEIEYICYTQKMVHYITNLYL